MRDGDRFYLANYLQRTNETKVNIGECVNHLTTKSFGDNVFHSLCILIKVGIKLSGHGFLDKNVPVPSEGEYPDDEMMQFLLILDDMNIKVDHIVLAMVYCKGELTVEHLRSGTLSLANYEEYIDVFIDTVKNRDANMVEAINFATRHFNWQPAHKVVVRGASFNPELL